MKSIYLVIVKSKSNHIKIMGAFEDEKLANIFCHHQEKETYNALERPIWGKFSVQKFDLMDESPEFIKTLI